MSLVAQLLKAGSEILFLVPPESDVSLVVTEDHSSCLRDILCPPTRPCQHLPAFPLPDSHGCVAMSLGPQLGTAPTF